MDVWLVAGENDRRMQEELDRQRAENVYLEELTKGIIALILKIDHVFGKAKLN